MDNYYPNNWQRIKDTPEEKFIAHSYRDVIAHKANAWDLPESVCCIIRIKNLKTKKIQEKMYRKLAYAQRKVDELHETPDIEFIVLDKTQMHFLTPDDQFDTDYIPNDEDDDEDYRKTPA